MQNDTIWCPVCGQINGVAFYVNGQNGKDTFGVNTIPEAYFVHITYEGKFFVCKNSMCNWPVMSPVRFLTLLETIKADYFKDLEARGNILFTMRDQKVIQQKIALNLAKEFTCPNCNRPIFFYKPYVLFSKYEKGDYDKKHPMLGSDYSFYNAFRSLP